MGHSEVSIPYCATNTDIFKDPQIIMANRGESERKGGAGKLQNAKSRM